MQQEGQIASRHYKHSRTNSTCAVKSRVLMGPATSWHHADTLATIHWLVTGDRKFHCLLHPC